MSRHKTRYALASLLFGLLAVSVQAENEARIIGYAVETDSEHSNARSGDAELAEWALEAWARVTEGSLLFEKVPIDDAQIRISFDTRRAGLFGEMVAIRVNNKPGAQVFVMADVAQLGDAIRERADKDSLYRDSVVYLTCVHEIGHALGLSHTDDFDDIMYYFGYGGDIPEFFGRYRRRLQAREDIRKHDGVSNDDRRRLLSVVERGGPLR